MTRVLKRDEPEPVDNSLVDQILADQAAAAEARTRGIAKLELLGLTPDEARAIAGG